MGVVSGKKRASEMFTYLKRRGIAEEQLSRIKAPAGIYIHSVTAEEIAPSIMAEIVEVARTPGGDPGELMRKKVTRSPSLSEEVTANKSAEIFVDPVRGMTIGDSSTFFSTIQGIATYFCCEGCKAQFDADPKKYLLDQNPR